MRGRSRVRPVLRTRVSSENRLVLGTSRVEVAVLGSDRSSGRGPVLRTVRLLGPAAWRPAFSGTAASPGPGPVLRTAWFLGPIKVFSGRIGPQDEGRSSGPTGSQDQPHGDRRPGDGSVPRTGTVPRTVRSRDTSKRSWDGHGPQDGSTVPGRGGQTPDAVPRPLLWAYYKVNPY